MKLAFRPAFEFSLLIILALLPVALGAQAMDPSTKNTFASGEQSSVPFEFRKGMIFVPVRLNGSKPLSFVLDTGSARMLVDRALATDLGLKRSGQGSLQGARAGRIPIEFVQNVSIGLPGLESTAYEFSTADLQPLQASLGEKVDGILGYEFFRRFVVTIDYESKTLTVALPKAFHPAETMQALPIELRDKWSFVKGELVLPGPVTVQDRFMIDIGSGDAVDHPIVTKLQSRTSTQSGIGFGATVQGATAQGTSFQLGRYILSNPTVSCCGATDETSKLIGNEVLKFFTITVDYPSARILISPNAAFARQSGPR
ncbi:MAG TPA: retropepsin-like aspartic protease [Terriglobales bacterium]|nr:retropepsin-like aspartic protease [Terriglobales bacterium]